MLSQPMVFDGFWEAQGCTNVDQIVRRAGITTTIFIITDEAATPRRRQRKAPRMYSGDADLVRLCLEGDTDAYGDLVERYQGAVYATAYYYVGRYGAAEDVSQDAFLAAYRSLPKLQDPSRFGPWLREITSRTAANWLRKHGKRIENETPLPYRRTVSIEEAAESPEGVMARGERYAQVQAAVDELPDHYRLPVVLRYLQELSYDEIAQFTGASRDEVRGLLQRAGKILREKLRDNDEEKETRQWRRAPK